MWMHAIPQRGCTDTVRDSALKVHSRRKVRHAERKADTLVAGNINGERDTDTVDLFI